MKSQTSNKLTSFATTWISIVGLVPKKDEVTNISQVNFICMVNYIDWIFIVVPVPKKNTRMENASQLSR